eukprot:CAMPEP_0184490144 /NCGR_PEP_ID=MMETSP0113_2-20130426/17201_1 /TAXON_ID=91329 /ORGANISM="Norrisiella sphaerica, Strain BC52" /LENGTH=57 /DNA_ID=CAMNT_0026873903 /DNA_START=1108 /DNA_END=1281 /DNA_ORIENTATION=+
MSGFESVETRSGSSQYLAPCGKETVDPVDATDRRFRNLAGCCLLNPDEEIELGVEVI